MELVIKITKELYDRYKEKDHIKRCDIDEFEKALDKCIILPKGHGDLIDRRELKKDVYTTTEWNGDVHRIIYEASVDDADTIVEADKPKILYKDRWYNGLAN